MNKTKFSTYHELLFQNNKLGIYNYYTKKFLIFEKNNDLIDFFMGYKYNTFIKQNQDLFSLLFCHGFIIDNKRDECSELLKKRVNFSQNDSIIALLVAPTMRCNLQCIYCFQHMKNMIHEKDISDALLSFIKTKQIQLIGVRWFGGEPSMCAILNVITRGCQYRHGRRWWRNGGCLTLRTNKITMLFAAFVLMRFAAPVKN